MMDSAFVRPFPEVIRIEPAAACNLACSHCATGTVDMERGLMEPATFERVLAEISRHKIRVVVLYHGGEPLLNKRFAAMVRAVKALGVPMVKTVSNGMLMRDGWAEAIVASGLDVISFSIDGISVEEHNLVRRQSDCATIIANVQRFLAVRKLMGSATPQVFINNIQFHADSGGPGAQPPAFLRQALPEGIAAIHSEWAFRYPHMNVGPEFEEVVDETDTDTKNECDHVQNVVTVRANGDVVACCYDLTSKLVLGNVLEHSLEEIWNGPRYLQLRREIEERRFAEPCINCSVVRPRMYLRLSPRRTISLHQAVSTAR